MILKKLSLEYYNLGVNFADIGNLTFAIRALRKASILDNANFQTLNVLGLCLYKRGDFPEAKKIWMESLRVYSGEKNPANKYLEAYKQSDFNKAIQIFNRALKDADSGNYNKSIKALTDKSFPCFDYCKFSNLLGLCYLGNRDLNNARIAFKKSLQIDSENTLTLNYLKNDWSNMDNLINKFSFLDFTKNLFLRRN